MLTFDKFDCTVESDVSTGQSFTHAVDFVCVCTRARAMARISGHGLVIFSLFSCRDMYSTFSKNDILGYTKHLKLSPCKQSRCIFVY